MTLTGHSLGGALAVIAAGLLTVAGHPPVELVTFGAPRAAGPKLRVLLAYVPVRQYRYGDDPVPLVPWLPGVFAHMRGLSQIGWPALNPISDHAIAKYEAEV